MLFSQSSGKYLLFCSVYLENFDYLYKDFFFKITTGNFGSKIGKILGNFRMGLGPKIRPPKPLLFYFTMFTVPNCCISSYLVELCLQTTPFIRVELFGLLFSTDQVAQLGQGLILHLLSILFDVLQKVICLLEYHIPRLSIKMTQPIKCLVLSFKVACAFT